MPVKREIRLPSLEFGLGEILLRTETFVAGDFSWGNKL